MAVIGASGSGKSSAVRAGLVPWLEAGGWQVLHPMKPGVSPLAKLAATFEPRFPDHRSQKQLDEFIHTHPEGLRQLADQLPGSAKFLLVVDQFEEVFTLSRTDEQQRLIDLLTQIAEAPHPRLAVVTTMRADFLEPCLQYSKLTHLIQTQAIFMPPLIGADLEQAIVEPAKRLGYLLEPGLLGEILHDVGQEPGCLPLLQFALLELWERRDRQNRRLTCLAYEEMGGVLGAVDRHAEQFYGQLSPSEQAWTKRLCLKLIKMGNALEDTRQRQPQDKLLELAVDPTTREIIAAILQALADTRLLVTGEEAGESWVDLAHESLMKSWHRFAEWRLSDRELRRLRDRVEDAYREWSHHQRSEQFLMMGGWLALVQEQWHNLEPELNSEVKSFYRHSDQHQRDKAAEANRQEQAVNSMSRYMPLELVEQLLENPDVVKQGGERKEVSVMFCGIKNYTILTETLAVEEAVEIINQYFEIMVDVIFTYGGIIDTYLGGQIVAVFGSPLPLDDHEWRAVQAALEMRRRLVDFNIGLQGKRQPMFKIGIGINSDTVISGNMGSSKHMKFTVTGDAVNLCADLEDSTKLYGTEIVISESVYIPCKDRIWAREVDFIQFKNTNCPIAVYELVGLVSEGISDTKKQVIEHYHKARQYYLNRKFALAVSEFANVLEIDSRDIAAILHMDRCQHWLQNPPPKNWDGAWTLRE